MPQAAKRPMRPGTAGVVFRTPPTSLRLPAVVLPRLPEVNLTLPRFRYPRSFALAWGAPPTPGGGGVNAGGGAGSFVVKRVKGDGRCLYRSIARSLADEERRELPPKLETADADALRHLAWRTMCVDRAQEFMRRHVVEGSLKSYCAAMRSTTFYAGEAEILALSDALKIPIRVFLESGRGMRNIATYGEQYKSKKTIRVLYNGTNHYNAVLKR